MRGFLVGLVLISVLGLSILSFRPGGLRRQLRFAARRFRLVLVLAGIYLAGSTAISYEAMIAETLERLAAHLAMHIDLDRLLSLSR